MLGVLRDVGSYFILNFAEYYCVDIYIYVYADVTYITCRCDQSFIYNFSFRSSLLGIKYAYVLPAVYINTFWWTRLAVCVWAKGAVRTTTDV